MEGSKEGGSSNFSANKFYGGELDPSSCSTRLQERLVQVARGAEYLDQHRLPTEYRPGILGPPATWKVFKKQAEAIRFSQVMGEGLMVFSFEGDAIGTGGKRNFVVTHPSQMWLRHSERIPEKRCVYEVIQENSVCKLYFDLEFLHAYNPTRNGVAMTNTLIDIVCYFLHKEFHITCSRKNIIDLRGTSDLKFSRHLIFNIPGIAFATNAHVGSFVRMVCNEVRLWHAGIEPIEVPGILPQNVKDLFVCDSKDSEVLFCDEGVYSRNRNFRLFLSTKLGQNFPLVIAEENEYLPNHDPGGCTDRQIFFDSLITLVDSTCKILTCRDTEQLPKEQLCKSNRMGNTYSDVEGFRQSPYPEIDAFIQGLIGSGSIQSWHYFSQSEVIVYNIVRFRYCSNIRREHKSNNIFYVVNLKTASYYQKCHDPDCRDFRSPSWPLPKNAVFWQNMMEEEMMDWIQSVQEEDDSTGKSATIALTAQSKNESKKQNVEVGGAMEKWGHMEDLIHSQGSSQRSLRSSQGSSQSSNPWDKLSQLSSPCTSFMENLSQSYSTETTDQNIEPQIFLPYDVESDEEFLRAVQLTELQCLGIEMEIAC